MSSKENFVCQDCGHVAPKWLGCCPECNNFNTFKVFREASVVQVATGGLDLTAIKYTSQIGKNSTHFSTRLNEVDRVLGGGHMPGGAILFGGQPGIGKSTLTMQLVLQNPANLYFSGEENVAQIRARAQRLHASQAQKAQIYHTTSLADIVATLQKHQPPVAIIDSIQMITSENAPSGFAGLRQLTEALIVSVKNLPTCVWLIGHITKADELAGPKALEHLVDVVLYLEGEARSELRILRASKNRFGPTTEIGVLSMEKNGLQAIANPSAFFLQERSQGSSGSVVTISREGLRNFLLEIQSLTVRTNFGQPRRTAHGIPLAKLHLLCAVATKFAKSALDDYDVYLNVVGGLRLTDPAIEAAILTALISSRLNKEVPADTIICGEVGLAGEIRSIAHLEARSREACKLGFKKFLCPRLPAKFTAPSGLQVIPVADVYSLSKQLWG